MFLRWGIFVKVGIVDIGSELCFEMDGISGVGRFWFCCFEGFFSIGMGLVFG